MRFIEDVALPYNGNACILWPFGRGSGGYPLLTIEGKVTIASRYVCTLINGEPPLPEFEAAHSCNRGHEGCIAKNHLSWKSRVENAADRIEAGTVVRGTQFPQSRLNEEKVRAIRSLRGIKSQKTIAKEFGVSETSVFNVQHRIKWAWVT